MQALALTTLWASHRARKRSGRVDAQLSGLKGSQESSERVHDLPDDGFGRRRQVLSDQGRIVHRRGAPLRDRGIWECTLHDLSLAVMIRKWERSNTSLEM